jgi:hypothetical protein
MAVYNSSSISRNVGPRGIGVYPVKDSGTITIASNITLSSTTTDTLPICKIPFGCFISSLIIGFPVLGTSLGLKLLDTLASPTTYIAVITQAAAGGVVGFGQMAATDTPKLGTIYGSTARSIGATGSPVVVWATGVQLNLAVITSSASTTGGSAVNITYQVEFAPMYDGGV